VKTTIR